MPDPGLVALQAILERSRGRWIVLRFQRILRLQRKESQDGQRLVDAPGDRESGGVLP